MCFSFFSSTNFTEKSCRLQQDSNSDRRSKRRANLTTWPVSFSLFLSFQQFTVYTRSGFIFANDWIWTADFWCQKRPLCQLIQNHCQLQGNVWKSFSISWCHKFPLLIFREMIFRLIQVPGKSYFEKNGFWAVKIFWHKMDPRPF